MLCELAIYAEVIDYAGMPYVYTLVRYPWFRNYEIANDDTVEGVFEDLIQRHTELFKGIYKAYMYYEVDNVVIHSREVYRDANYDI